MTSPQAMPPRPATRPKLALVLGSGGLKPLAAFPLIDFLEAHGIRPDLLVGCSGGAATLALWSTGSWNSERLESSFSSKMKPSVFTKNWRNIAIMLGVFKKGFNPTLAVFNQTPLMDMLYDLYGDLRLENLAIPLVLQATDLHTGEGVEMDSGSLVEAVYASCAAYPFLPPILRNGRWLFDGVFSAPVPILPAVRRGIDIVVTLDFAEKLQPKPTNLFEAMGHLNSILSKAVAESQMLASIHLHSHETLHVKVRFPTTINIWEVDAFERILAAGRQAVAEYGEEILALFQPTVPEAAEPHLGPT